MASRRPGGLRRRRAHGARRRRAGGGAGTAGLPPAEPVPCRRSSSRFAGRWGVFIPSGLNILTWEPCRLWWSEVPLLVSCLEGLGEGSQCVFFEEVLTALFCGCPNVVGLGIIHKFWRTGYSPGTSAWIFFFKFDSGKRAQTVALFPETVVLYSRKKSSKRALYSRKRAQTVFLKEKLKRDIYISKVKYPPPPVLIGISVAVI